MSKLDGLLNYQFFKFVRTHHGFLSNFECLLLQSFHFGSFLLEGSLQLYFLRLLFLHSSFQCSFISLSLCFRQFLHVLSNLACLLGRLNL